MSHFSGTRVMKPSVLELFRNRLPASMRVGVLVSCLVALVVPPAFANPQGGKVISGNAEIAEALGKLTVNQGSSKAIIEWESFSIGAGEITQFIQPGSNATALNRVMGASPSVLNGILKANGNVWLINQNGVVVGPNGLIDVGGFLASTLEIDDDDFLRGGDVTLKGNSEAAVQNFGTIKAASGDLFLVGRTVENHGVLGAFEGTVGLAAGNSVLIKAKGAGDERVFVSAGEGSVNNTGEIRSAVTELKAHGNAYALAINNPGAVRATGTSQQGGRVFLRAATGTVASQGDITAENVDGSGGTIEMANGAGEIEIGGILSASGRSGSGGAVTVSGAGVDLLANARVEAKGTSGGTIEIGGTAGKTVTIGEGTMLQADGVTGAGGRVEVNGGEVVVYRNSTLGANGETNGGMISVTGTSRVESGGLLTARGATGMGGTVSVTGTSLSLGSNGSVIADGAVKGGTVEMSAADSARIGGLISASGADGGRVALEAGRNLEAAGYILAIGDGAIGGRIDLEAGEVSLMPGASIDVSGRFGGGQANVGGSFQGKADSTVRNSWRTTVAEGVDLRADSALGNAGQVVIWSDGTTGFSGAISAQALGTLGRGGRIEVSGKQDLLYRGSVTAAAVSGQSGSVLFDPGDVYIGGSASNIPIASLNTILQGKTDVIVATESGSIFVQDIGLADNRHNAVQWTSNASLGLFASGNIYITNHIRTSGAGSVNLIAGWKGSEADLISPVVLGDFGATDVGVSTAVSLDIGSFLAAGTVLPTGSVLNGVTLTAPQTLGNTPITAATTIATNGTIAQGSILAGAGSFGTTPSGTPGWTLSEVERSWKTYVENKEFGDEGTILIGRADLERHVEVGSRYGNTNLAANTLLMSAAQTNSDQRWTQLGFHDSGVVFVPQAAGTGGRGVDLHDTLNNNIVQSVRQGQLTGITDPLLIIDTRLAVAIEANATGRNDLPPVTITLRDSGQDNPATRAIRVGDIVTGTGILAHTYVTAINGDVITLSKPTSGVAAAVDTVMTFSRPGANAVATVGQFEIDRLAYNTGGSQVTNSTFDPTNINAPAPDGIVDGVMLVNDTGPVAGTFMAYANHFNNQAQGNWWWQRIEAVGSPERTGGVGANRPEMGAGLSASSRADINVLLTGRLSMEAGGRQNNAVQIGHGGIGTTGNASRSVLNTAPGTQLNTGTDSNGISQSLLTPTLNSYSLNGAGNGMVNQSIGRLAPIHSHINVIAGADLTKSVVFNPLATNPAGILQADVVTGRGDVLLRGRQALTSSNGGSATSPDNNIEYAYAQIGHLGAGQFGSVRGDIKVLAGGDVTLQAGRQNYAWATIGHTFGSRLNDWNNPSNGDAQVRLFSNPTDFDNPNWRVGELFALPVVNGSGQLQVGTAAARGAYPVAYDPLAAAVGAVPNVQRTAGYWDVNFQATPNQTQWASTTGNSGNTQPGATPTDPRVPLADYLAFSSGRGRSASGPVTPTSVGIPALMGLTDKTIVGNVTVKGSGANGVTMLSGFTDDLGGNTLTAAFTPDVGSILAAGTQLPAGSTLNGVAQTAAVTLLATTPVTSATTIGIGGFIAPGSEVRTDALGAQLTLDNKSVYTGRITQIGHGGVAAGRGDIGGWNTGLGIFGTNATTFDSGSRDMVNLAGTAIDANLSGGAVGTANRQITGLNLIGDIEVRALVGGVSQTAGNHFYDYSQIGHGGAELADIESSSMAVGDVTVFAKTNVSIRGSAVEYTGNSLSTSGLPLPIRAYAKVGHGGYLDGLYYKAGDITVTADTGDLTVVAGRQQGQFAQIGHSGISSWGQVGGNVDRNDSFSFTNRSTRFDVARSATMEVVAGVPTITLSGGENGIASGGLVLNTYGNTANVNVSVGRNILMDNERSGLLGFFNYRFLTDPLVPGVFTTAQIGNNNGTTALAASTNQNAWALIGHGGWDVDQVAGDNDDAFYHPSYRVADKVGNIDVQALGNLTMRSGDTLYRWSAIGHFANGNGLDRSYFSAADTISGLRLGGRVNVNVAGDLRLDAAFAEPRNRNPQATDGLGLPAQLNPVQIGHGGVFDVRNYVVVDVDNDPALDMNGIANVQSDITVRTGRDLSILGGRGGANSFAQVGHGFVTDLPDALRYRGQTIGISGNIKSVVGRDLTMTGGTNLAVSIPGGIPAAAALGTSRIGHNLLTRLGDIQVSVGNNATFARSAVGHAAYQNLNSIGSNTFLAVSRTQPSYRLGGSGVMATTSGDIFTSGGSGQLRLYMPNRPNNAIAVGTLFNGFSYTDPELTNPPDSGDAVSLEAGDARGDEYLNYFEHTITFDAQSIPNGTFTPEGPYSPVNAVGGAYGIYYNNSGPGLPPPPTPQPPPVIPPPIDPTIGYIDSLGNVFSFKIDVFERQDEYVDGSFFNFSQWRDPEGERPYTVDYIGGLGLGSASVVNLRGFVVPVPVNLKEALPQEVPLSPNGTILPQGTSKPNEAFKTETQGSGVQTQMTDPNDPFGTPAPAPAPAGGAPAMEDPFGGTPPAPGNAPAPAGGAPAMEDPFGGTPPAPGKAPAPAGGAPAMEDPFAMPPAPKPTN
jgi:filamentous hemagglutinin family protein